MLSDAPRSQFFGGQRTEEGNSTLNQINRSLRRDLSGLNLTNSGMKSNILSDAPKMTLKTRLESEQSIYPLFRKSQKQAQNAEALAPSEELVPNSEQQNFVTLEKISEE